jgi:acetolactate synthase-1/2/3 large subunit
VGVCLATSGPGATNLVTGIATAMMDSSPIVAITGQVATSFIGKDAFQEVDITGITLPITKHSYLVTDLGELPQALREAFYLARSGRPGPVLVDIAKDVQIRLGEYVYPEEPVLPGYRPTRAGNPRQVALAAELINGAERPLIIAGRGVILAGAEAELRELAERAGMPVVTTLLGIGALPETHPLSLGMAGMHGEAYVNLAVQEADLLLVVGSRLDDRLTDTLQSFAPQANIVHIDIDPAEIGKNVAVHLPIVGDAACVLRTLLPQVQPASHPEWLAHIQAWREQSAERDILNQPGEGLAPQRVVRALWEATRGQALMVSDVGQNQMWEAQYYLHDRPRGLLSSGGLGTMGFALPAAIGAQLAQPDAPVWVTVGDGGFQMNLQELATVVQERLPIKIAILNNGFLGMVRQWQEMFFGRRYSASPLLGPDFVRLAEAYGILGLRATRPDEVALAIAQASAHPGPALIDFHVTQDENVYPMVEPGAGLSQMIRRPNGRRRQAQAAAIERGAE